MTPTKQATINANVGINKYQEGTHMKRTISILISVLLLIFLSTASLAEETNLLEKIKERGYLSVGTSSDHMPWAFVDDKNEFAGFDMDLIREIASRIGVETKITDMSFSALVAAVQTGKVDVAICSMGAKPERLEKVDFTQAYHKQANVLAVQSESELTFKDPTEMKDYKVGAITGSIPEAYVEGLVNQGLMSENQVFHYTTGEEMTLDLMAGRIDVVAWDYSTVKEYTKLYDMKIALKVYFGDTGENIAVPKNQPELLTTLDSIIDDLYAEGWLEESYLKWSLDN